MGSAPAASMERSEGDGERREYRGGGDRGDRGDRGPRRDDRGPRREDRGPRRDDRPAPRADEASSEPQAPRPAYPEYRPGDNAPQP